MFFKNYQFSEFRRQVSQDLSGHVNHDGDDDRAGGGVRFSLSSQLKS
jgi:hypothetical protein